MSRLLQGTRPVCLASLATPLQPTNKIKSFRPLTVVGNYSIAKLHLGIVANGTKGVELSACGNRFGDATPPRRYLPFAARRA